MFELEEWYCPLCGKRFIPYAQWAWKDRNGRYCSYSCYRKARKRSETKKKYRYKEVEQLDKDKNVLRTFECVNDAVNEVDGIYNGIATACRTGLLYKGYYWRYVEDGLSEVQEQKN